MNSINLLITTIMFLVIIILLITLIGAKQFINVVRNEISDRDNLLIKIGRIEGVCVATEQAKKESEKELNAKIAESDAKFKNAQEELSKLLKEKDERKIGVVRKVGVENE